MGLFKKTPPEVRQYKKEVAKMMTKAVIGKVTMDDVYEKLEEGMDKGYMTEEEYYAILQDMSDSLDKSMRLQQVIREKSLKGLKKESDD